MDQTNCLTAKAVSKHAAPSQFLQDIDSLNSAKLYETCLSDQSSGSMGICNPSMLEANAIVIEFLMQKSKRR